MEDIVKHAEARISEASKLPCSYQMLQLLTSTACRKRQRHAIRVDEEEEDDEDPSSGCSLRQRSLQSIVLAAARDPEEATTPLDATCRCKGFVPPDLDSVCKGIQSRRARDGEDVLGSLLCLGCKHELAGHRRLTGEESSLRLRIFRGVAVWISNGMLSMPLKGLPPSGCQHHGGGGASGRQSGSVLADGCKVVCARNHSSVAGMKGALQGWSCSELGVSDGAARNDARSISSLICGIKNRKRVDDDDAVFAFLLTPPAGRVVDDGCPTSYCTLPLSLDGVVAGMLTVRTYRCGAATISSCGAATISRGGAATISRGATEGTITWKRAGGTGALLCSALVAGGSIVALGGEDEGISLLGIDASALEDKAGGDLRLVGGQEMTLYGHTSFITDLSYAGSLPLTPAKGSRPSPSSGRRHALLSCSLDMKVMLWAICPRDDMSSSCVLQVVDLGVQLTCLLPREMLTEEEEEEEEEEEVVVGERGECGRGVLVGVVSRTWSIGAIRIIP